MIEDLSEDQWWKENDEPLPRYAGAGGQIFISQKDYTRKERPDPIRRIKTMQPAR